MQPCRGFLCPGYSSFYSNIVRFIVTVFVFLCYGITVISILIALAPLSSIAFVIIIRGRSWLTLFCSTVILMTIRYIRISELVIVNFNAVIFNSLVLIRKNFERSVNLFNHVLC